MSEQSILYPTEERREEALQEFVEDLSFIDDKKADIEPLKELIPQLPPVDLGSIATMLEGYEMKLNELVVLLDEVTDLVQITIEQKTSSPE